jgi:hypothetical protein
MLTALSKALNKPLLNKFPLARNHNVLGWKQAMIQGSIKAVG